MCNSPIGDATAHFSLKDYEEGVTTQLIREITLFISISQKNKSSIFPGKAIIKNDETNVGG